MNNELEKNLFVKYRNRIQTDNLKVSETFEIVLMACVAGLLLVSCVNHDYSLLAKGYVIYFWISLVLYLVTRFYVRKHLVLAPYITSAILLVAYSYSILSGIFFNIDGPSITVYALMVAACSAYMLPYAITVVSHVGVGVIYCILALLLKPAYGVQDTINYVFFLSMALVLTRIVYQTRLTNLRALDDAEEQKRLALLKIQLQTELENSQKTLAVALKAAQVMAWHYDYKTGTITDSATLQELNLPKVVTNMPQAILDMGVIAPDSIESLRKFYQDVKSESSVSVETHSTLPCDSGTRWFRQIYTPMFDEKGNYVDSVGIAVDITKQKNQELHYKEQLRLNDAAIKDAVAIAKYNLTKNLVIDSTSNKAILVGGGSASTIDEMIEAMKTSMMNKEDQEKLLQVANRERLLKDFANGITHAEFLHHLMDDIHWYQTTFDLVRNPYSGDVEAISSIHDVTNRVRAELVASQLIEIDYQSILIIDATSGLVYPFSESEEDRYLEEVLSNQKAEQDAMSGLYKFFQSHIDPADFEQVWHENQISTILQQLEHEIQYETAYSITDDGTKQYFRTVYSRLQGEKNLLLCAVQNVTELYVKDEKAREELSKALTQAKAANQAKTAFLSRVSHDMRTPLNGILGLTNLIKKQVPEQGGVARDLTELEVSGRYLLNLINDTLDVSRIESGRLELHPVVTDGRALLHSLLTLMETATREKQITFTKSIEDLPYSTLYIDVGRTEQVIMNVFSNAVKFTPKGGSVDLHIRNLSCEEDRIVDELTITDNGIGMEKEFLTQIFEPFAQEDATRTSMHKGTGLGMSITKEVLQVMGGTISIESEKGQGTKVTIVLPLRIATASQKKAKDELLSEHAGKEILKGKRVLLVEDHRLNTIIATRLLEAVGMKVDHAENGKIAVEMFNASEENAYDIVLMDIRMPVMDGLDASREIRKLKRADARLVPIVAMTANAFADDISQTMDAGMNAHLSKPIEPDRLYRTMSEWIASR